MIVTISQNLEYKEWNYVTGVVVKEFLIDLGGLKEFHKEKTFQNSDYSDSDSDSEDSSDALDPIGDDAKFSKTSASKAQPETKPKNLVACHVCQEGFAYLAIDNNKIIIYNLSRKEVQSIFESY